MQDVMSAAAENSVFGRATTKMRYLGSWLTAYVCDSRSETSERISAMASAWNRVQGFWTSSNVGWGTKKVVFRSLLGSVSTSGRAAVVPLASDNQRIEMRRMRYARALLGKHGFENQPPCIEDNPQDSTSEYSISTNSSGMWVRHPPAAVEPNEQCAKCTRRWVFRTDTQEEMKLCYHHSKWDSQCGHLKCSDDHHLLCKTCDNPPVTRLYSDWPSGLLLSNASFPSPTEIANRNHTVRPSGDDSTVRNCSADLPAPGLGRSDTTPTVGRMGIAEETQLGEVEMECDPEDIQTTLPASHEKPPPAVIHRGPDFDNEDFRSDAEETFSDPNNAEGFFDAHGTPTEFLTWHPPPLIHDSWRVMKYYPDGSCPRNEESRHTCVPSGWGCAIFGSKNILLQDAQEEIPYLDLHGTVRNQPAPRWLGSERSSKNTEELSAVGEALWHVVLYGAPNIRHEILTDSQYTIDLLEGKSVPSSNKIMIRYLQRLHKRAKRQFDLHLIKVGSHTNVEGNEKADGLAALGAAGHCSAHGRWSDLSDTREPNLVLESRWAAQYTDIRLTTAPRQIHRSPEFDTSTTTQLNEALERPMVDCC